MFFLMSRFFFTTKSFKSIENVMFAWGFLQLSQLWRLTSSFDDPRRERIICTVCPCGYWPMLNISAPSFSLLSNSKVKKRFEISSCTFIFLISFSRLLRNSKVKKKLRNLILHFHFLDFILAFADLLEQINLLHSMIIVLLVVVIRVRQLRELRPSSFPSAMRIPKVVFFFTLATFSSAFAFAFAFVRRKEFHQFPENRFGHVPAQRALRLEVAFFATSEALATFRFFASFTFASHSFAAPLLHLSCLCFNLAPYTSLLLNLFFIFLLVSLSWRRARTDRTRC